MMIRFYTNENVERVGIPNVIDRGGVYNPPAPYGTLLSYILNLDLDNIRNNILNPLKRDFLAELGEDAKIPFSLSKKYREKEKILFLEYYPLISDLHFNSYYNRNIGDYFFDEMKKIYDYIDLCIEDDFYYSYNTFSILMTSNYFYRGIRNPIILFFDNERYIIPIENIEDMKNYKKTLIENKNRIHQYKCDSVFDVCKVSLLELFKNNYIVKKCANCGKYFVPLYRSDTIYCNSMTPQDNTKTCQEYGSYKAWSDNLKNDEVARKYRNTYMKLQLLVKRNPTIIEYKNKFEEFKTLSKQWKLDVKNGVKSKEEYLKWINTY